jgi:hypothetical protein
MNLKMDKEELKILQILDAIVRQEAVIEMIDLIIPRVERKLTQESEALLAWEPLPLVVYGESLPKMIRSSWVFILRAQVNTGAERHPNSHQLMMSYRGSGDIQIWAGESMPLNPSVPSRVNFVKGWRSNYLVSDSDAQIDSRWISIPPNIWHQAVVPEENWVVVSFHTVLEDELIEERPDATDIELTYQRRYLGASF